MGYNFVSEDDETYKIKHPDGSEFSVAKKALSKSLHSKIKGLEPIKMADGGIVPSYEEDFLIDSENPENEIPALSGPSGLQGPLIEQPIQEKLAVSNQTPPEPNLSTPELNPYEKSSVSLNKIQPVEKKEVIPGMEGLPDSYAKSLKQAQDSIKMGAQAQARGFEQQAKVQEQLVNDLKQAEIKTQERLAPIEEKSRILYDSIMNDKVDPNRVWNQSSTANKIVSVFSILMSGIGSGIAGGTQRNMALDVLDNAINQDIDAQKANIRKKESLYSENLRLLGDERQAALATKSQLLSVAQAQIQAIGLKTNSQEAKAKELSALGQIEMQKAQIRQQLQKDQVVSQMAGGGTSMSDAQIQQMPEEIRKRAVKVGGKYVLALDDQAAKSSREIIGSHDSMMSNLDELINLRKQYGAETIPGPVKAKMQNIASNLELAMKESKKLGTLDAGAERYMKKIVADPTSYTFALDSYKALKEVQNKETNAKLKALGVNIPEGSYQNTVERVTKDGRVALFDPQTKNFIGYKQ